MDNAEFEGLIEKWLKLLRNMGDRNCLNPLTEKVVMFFVYRVTVLFKSNT